MSKNNGTSGKRRMPVKRRRVDMEGDYADWWWEFRTNPPLGKWAEGAKIAATYDSEDATTASNAVEGMLRVLEVVLLDWNFVDEKGEPLPLTREGLDQLPLEMLSAMFASVNERVAEAPLAVGSS